MSLLSVLQLDTNLPPVWTRDSDATYDLPPGLSPHTNPDALLRPTVRQDPLHYYTSQRSQGDLFKRDLLLQQQINLLAANLGGLTFAVPVTRLAPGKYASLPILAASAFTGLNISAIGCTTPDATPSTSYRMQLVDTSLGTVIYEVDSTVKFVLFSSTALNVAHGYQMRAINLKTGTSVTPTTDVNCGNIGGFVILSPQI